MEPHKQGDNYSFTCEQDELSVCVIRAVAWVKGVEPTELESLYNVVDMEALETLVQSHSRGQLTIDFELAGCEIQIDADRTVTIREQASCTPGEFTDDNNLLVLDTSNEQNNEKVCSELLHLKPFEDENVLMVTFSSATANRNAILNSASRNSPANLGLLTVGGITRSTSTHSPCTDPNPGPVRMETVADPADLSALGIQIKDLLSTWEDNSNQSILCFHSLDELLQATDLKQTFRFLHVLKRYIESADAIAHFHLTADAHDEKTIETLKSLFETVFEYDQVDGWSTGSV